MDFNDTIIAEFRANNGHVTTAGFGDSLVLVHSIGAKSGDERVSPVMAIPAEDGWLIAASAAGAPQHPAWYFNLVANPHATIETPAEPKVSVTAIDLQGAARDEAWAKFTARSSGFADYQVKAGDRIIPVVLLRRD